MVDADDWIVADPNLSSHKTRHDKRNSLNTLNVGFPDSRQLFQSVRAGPSGILGLCADYITWKKQVEAGPHTRKTKLFHFETKEPLETQPEGARNAFLPDSLQWTMYFHRGITVEGVGGRAAMLRKSGPGSCRK
jgi:hypothetical protein